VICCTAAAAGRGDNGGMRLFLRAGLALLLAIVLVAAGIRYVFPQLALSIALDVEHWRAGLVEREIRLPDGLRISYLEGGRGEDLVLLHGFGADKDNFIRIAPFLEPSYRVIVPDLVGFGDSSHPADADYSPAAQAERVRAFCKALGLTSFHLGGSSMGGQIALTLAAAHPHEVRSLWLLDPGGIWSAPESEATRTMRESGRTPLLVSSEDDFATQLALTMSRPPPIPRFLQDLMARRRIANRALEERIQRQARADSIESRIDGLRTSTLVVFGANDRVINPATAQLLKKLLPHSHVVIMPGVGHLPALEEPGHAASDYIRFRDSM
jgi:pimeloyl-ACP methyl ester carboxylesterase